jgi:predicted MPP superfamily phosphohydrolase
LPSALDGLRIAHLTDFHVAGDGFPVSRLRAAITLAVRERPDLVALTGDYIVDSAGTLTSRTADMAACAQALTSLARSARLGAFAVFGNHDFWPAPGDHPPLGPWYAAGVRPLLDEAITLVVPGRDARITLIGLLSSLVRPTAPAPVLARLPARRPDEIRLLLWHEPDRADESAQAGADVQLSGHTHGGQVVVPGVGPLALPPQGQKYPAGLFRVGPAGMPLYVSRGVGMLPPRVRFCCPPEVSLLTLRRR